MPLGELNNMLVHIFIRTGVIMDIRLDKALWEKLEEIYNLIEEARLEMEISYLVLSSAFFVSFLGLFCLFGVFLSP